MPRVNLVSHAGIYQYTTGEESYRKVQFSRMSNNRCEIFSQEYLSAAKRKIQTASIGKLIKDENPDTYIAPELLDFADGNVVLPTVSRRDPIRKEIDLWTSTQRGFKIKGWRAIWKIVEGIRDSLSFEEIFESIRREYPNATISESEKSAVEKVWRELQSHFGG